MKARLRWRFVLGTVSKDTNVLMLHTSPGPVVPSTVLSRGSPAPWDAVLPSQTRCAVSVTLQGQEDRGLWVCLRHLLTLRKMLARVFH